MSNKNDEMLHKFVSTGRKLLRHGSLIESWNMGIPSAQSLQVALTEKCNLSCKFCSVVNREKKYEFDYNNLVEATKQFISLGIDTVELSIKGDELVPIKDNNKLMLKTIKEIVENKNGNSFTLNTANQFDEGIITDFIEHPQTEPLYKITLDDGRNITVTKSHSIFFFEDKTIVYKKISDAKQGDIVIVLLKNPEIKEEELDNDFCRLLGYFVAEGSYSWQRDKVPHGIHFSFAENELYVDDAVTILEKLGYKCSVYNYGNSKTHIAVFSKELCEQFLNLNMGRKANQKRVPDIILNATFNNKIEFLKGLFAEDGNFRNTASHENWRRNALNLKTSSKIMTQSLGYLLDLMGIWFTINCGKNKKRYIDDRELPETDYYVVNISDRENLEKIQDVVRFIGGEFIYTNSKYGNHIRKKKRIDINPDCYGIRIKKIEEISPEEKVYDISVKDTHRFEGSFRILCHNTGGGDPLLYPQFNAYIRFLVKNNLKIGLITNGININEIIDKELINKFAWIRISANVYDYKNKIDIPKNYTGTLGFSYCWTEGISSVEYVKKIRDIAIENKVKYIRLVPNCLGNKQEQEEKNKFLPWVAAQVGEPMFYQPKIFDTFERCFFGYIKPFLYCDEFVYPCSSVVLNTGADKQFNTKYRWCHWKDVEEVWSEPIKSIIDTSKCNHCVFTEQNMLLDYALNAQEHEDFV